MSGWHVRLELDPDSGGNRLQQAGGLAADALAEQILLGAEVGVDHRLGDAGHLGDLVHGRAVVAALGEHRDGGVEDLPLPHIARQPLDPLPRPLLNAHPASRFVSLASVPTRT
jgi:hypothetical protein